MKHLGDIRNIRGDEIEPVDCIIGGSPCQDLSVAGKKAGLSGERSGLFLEQIRIIREMRERDKKNGVPARAVRPRFMVWENVPGAFSSGHPKGADFARVLEEVLKICDPEFNVCISVPQGRGWPKSGCFYDEDGNWSVAWRVHDAQFWGVPQRRKRIALVADFGGRCAPEILFERKSLCGNSDAGGEAREGAAGRAAQCAGGACGDGGFFTMRERAGKEGGGKGPLIQTGKSGPLVTHNDQYVFCLRGNAIDRDTNCNGRWYNTNKSFTLTTQDYHGVTVPETAVMCFDENNITSKYNRTRTEWNGVSNTLHTAGPLSVCVANLYSLQSIGEYKANHVTSSIKSRDSKGATDIILTENGGTTLQTEIGVSGTLVSDNKGNVPCVMGVDFRNGTEKKEVSITMQAHERGGTSLHATPSIRYETSVYDARGNGDGETAPTMTGDHQNRISDYTGVVCNKQLTVRRLTPLECERLQGYPDGWTDIGEWTDSKGRTHQTSDTARYKALGNSIALPFWQWLINRMADKVWWHTPTMGSLFDGIGGFPLCWERRNGKGTARWASEIDGFAIAVTTKHFPDEGTENHH